MTLSRPSRLRGGEATLSRRVRRITSHGLTRKGELRDENQDGFGAYPELGLFVVVDSFHDARTVTLTLEAFERAVTEALRDKKLDGALTTAGRLAHRIVKSSSATDKSMWGAGAEFAALLIHDDIARVAWSGHCQVYRARGEAVDVLSRGGRSPGREGPAEKCDRSVSIRRLPFRGDVRSSILNPYQRLGCALRPP
jgi:hypothetical protein